MLANGRSFARFASGLGSYLRAPMDLEECRRRSESQLRGRSESFLRVLERGIFARSESPYRRLCEHAGFSFEAIAGWVRRDGVEPTLGRLYDGGVRLSFEEFKGRVPIEREGLTLRVGSDAFDNPLLDRAYRGQTGGSRGPGTRVSIDLDLLAHDAALNALAEEAFGLRGRPRAQWRPVPPASAAMSDALRTAKAGQTTQRWFSQSRLEWRRDTLKYAAFTTFVLAASRLHGNPLPRPVHVPLGRIDRVVDWLAEQVRSGAPALMSCPASSAVRICRSAQERGIDLAGTWFRVGGDPLTRSKAAIITGAGCQVFARYSLNELGNIGMPCTRPTAPDSVHLLTGKIGVIQRDHAVGSHGDSVSALIVTTLLPASPKLMLNVDIGDYAVLEEAECGCPMARFGMSRPIHDILSHEKLTSEGMSFSGEDLLQLVEDTLPARFGGSSADFQLVEHEVNGLPRVSVVVSPRIGVVDEAALIEVVLEALGARRAAWRMAAETWRRAETLRVERREPYATSSAKILPFHHAVAS